MAENAIQRLAPARRNALQKLIDVAQGANNSAASTVSAPVDAIAWALRKAGAPIGDQPFGGSEWMRAHGLTAEPQNQNAGYIGEALGSVMPTVVAAKAPQIAGALVQAGRNLAVPTALGKQAGMIRIPGRGQIPETRSEVNRLADRLGGLLDDVGAPYVVDKSRISPARYFNLDSPVTGENFKVRISDHINKHGADISVDPHSGSTFEEALQYIREQGIPIASRVKPASKAVIDDATLEKIWGGPLASAPKSWIDRARTNYVLTKYGTWTEKR